VLALLRADCKPHACIYRCSGATGCGGRSSQRDGDAGSHIARGLASPATTRTRGASPATTRTGGASPATTRTGGASPATTRTRGSGRRCPRSHCSASWRRAQPGLERPQQRKCALHAQLHMQPWHACARPSPPLRFYTPSCICTARSVHAAAHEWPHMHNTMSSILHGFCWISQWLHPAVLAQGLDGQ
jgi:hypothetical protein